MNLNLNTRTYKLHTDSLRCSIENCGNKPIKGKLIYPMPPGPIRCLWTDIIRRHNKNPHYTLTNYVCCDHFSDDQKLPNGHLKGNAVPNIFPPSLPKSEPFPITCQFCDQFFKSRKELYAHDQMIHVDEYSKMNINIVTIPSAETVAATNSPCEKCQSFEQIYQSIRKTRNSLLTSINDIKELQAGPADAVRLRVDSDAFIPIDVDSL